MAAPIRFNFRIPRTPPVLSGQGLTHKPCSHRDDIDGHKERNKRYGNNYEQNYFLHGFAYALCKDECHTHPRMANHPISVIKNGSKPGSTHPPSKPAADPPSHCRPPQNPPSPPTPED